MVIRQCNNLPKRDSIWRLWTNKQALLLTQKCFVSWFSVYFQLFSFVEVYLFDWKYVVSLWFAVRLVVGSPEQVQSLFSPSAYGFKTTTNRNSGTSVSAANDYKSYKSLNASHLHCKPKVILQRSAHCLQANLLFKRTKTILTRFPHRI